MPSASIASFASRVALKGFLHHPKRRFIHRINPAHNSCDGE